MSALRRSIVWATLEMMSRTLDRASSMEGPHFYSWRVVDLRESIGLRESISWATLTMARRTSNRASSVEEFASVLIIKGSRSWRWACATEEYFLSYDQDGEEDFWQSIKCGGVCICCFQDREQDFGLMYFIILMTLTIGERIGMEDNSWLPREWAHALGCHCGTELDCSFSGFRLKISSDITTKSFTRKKILHRHLRDLISSICTAVACWTVFPWSMLAKC